MRPALRSALRSALRVRHRDCATAVGVPHVVNDPLAVKSLKRNCYWCCYSSGISTSSTEDELQRSEHVIVKSTVSPPLSRKPPQPRGAHRLRIGRWRSSLGSPAADQGGDLIAHRHDGAIAHHGLGQPLEQPALGHQQVTARVQGLQVHHTAAAAEAATAATGGHGGGRGLGVGGVAEVEERLEEEPVGVALLELVREIARHHLAHKGRRLGVRPEGPAVHHHPVGEDGARHARPLCRGRGGAEPVHAPQPVGAGRERRRAHLGRTSRLVDSP
eukprot:scaffold2211_cov65-Phaeocystis_antarctica.AAC.5